MANERLQMTPDGNVRLLLKKAFRDGTAEIQMQPLALLTRLATANTSFGYVDCRTSLFGPRRADNRGGLG